MKIVNANRPLKRSPAAGQQNGALGVQPSVVNGDLTDDKRNGINGINGVNGQQQPTDLSTGSNTLAPFSAHHHEPNVYHSSEPNSPSSSAAFSPPPLVKAPSPFDTENTALDMKKPLFAGHQVQPPLTPNHENNIANGFSSKSLLAQQQHHSPSNKLPNGLSMLAAAARARNGISGRKVSGCRSCANCLAEDCGKCNYCLDKPKFGGKTATFA